MNAYLFFIQKGQWMQQKEPNLNLTIVTIEGSNSFFLNVFYDQKFRLVEFKNQNKSNS
jgi:hypothetical protein